MALHHVPVVHDAIGIDAAAPRGRPSGDLSRTADPDRAVVEARFGSGDPVPSDWDEPFGLVAAEAQAAGTPVVAFARGGLTEIIDDTVTGYLVEPGSVAEAVDRRAVRDEPGPATLPAARGRPPRHRERASQVTRPSTLRSRGVKRRPTVSRATHRRTSGGPSEASRRPRSSDPRDPVGRAGRPDPARHRRRSMESEGARPRDPARRHGRRRGYDAGGRRRRLDRLADRALGSPGPGDRPRSTASSTPRRCWRWRRPSPHAGGG